MPEAGLDQTPRLTAAAEALARYEGRLERNLASRPSGVTDIVDELALFSGWADNSYERLSQRIGTREGWPASKEDIQVFFEARARAQVVSQILTASLVSEPDIAVRNSVESRLDQIEAYWRRAAELDPIFVSNQAGDARLMADHLAMMAFYLRQAGDSTRELGAALLSEEQARLAAQAEQEAGESADATDS